MPARQTLRASALLALVMPLCLSPDSAPAQAPADPDPALLASELGAALGAADWEAAVAPAEALAQLAQEEHLAALYRLLGIHCRRGDRPAAYATLEVLLNAGWWDHGRLRQDPDLALINQEDRCRAMLRRAWSKQYIGMLERESRDTVQKPTEIMAALGLRPGERVADIGAGSGYFTLRIAQAVGDRGKVWALDIRQEMLDHIAGRLAEAQLANVELKLVPPDDPLLPAGGIDTVLMVDTIHYVQDRTAYARKLRAALAPGGRVVVIDFRYDPTAQREFAPPPEQQVPQATLESEFATAGLGVERAYDFLPEQYFLVFTAE
jgi:SAM-dependent methyltransferase